MISEPDISYLFMYCCLSWISVAVQVSLVVENRSHALVAVCGLLGVSRCLGFSSCITQARYLQPTDLVAPQHVGSPQIRDRTCVSLCWQADSLPLSYQGSSKCLLMKMQKAASLSLPTVPERRCPLNPQ